MKKLFLLLATIGMAMTACGPIDDGTENKNDNPTEQPGEDEIPADKIQTIKFQDKNTKSLCILHWDTDKDGELSYEEAAAVTDIGTAFRESSISEFTELKHFTGITSIASHAFFACDNLTSVTIPNKVTSIGDSAFLACGSLTSVTIPDSVTSIGDNAFNTCGSLPNITIPNKVSSIGNSVFAHCGSLTSITIPNSVISIGNNVFYCCSSLASATIGNNVSSIGTQAFYSCSSLTNITIPDNVTSIKSYAFMLCSGLTNVTIGNSVTSIEKQAFSSCSKLKDVYCKPTTPPSGHEDIFKNNASDRKIYVPTASVDTYKAAAYWSDYASSIVGYDF